MSMRLAYADPPYPGQAKRHYKDHSDYAGEVNHGALVERLVGYDGWALSTTNRSLREILLLCPPDVRVLAWNKPIAPPFPKHGVYGWEPVIVSWARHPPTDLRDTLTISPEQYTFRSKPEGYVTGSKPPRVLPVAVRMAWSKSWRRVHRPVPRLPCGIGRVGRLRCAGGPFPRAVCGMSWATPFLAVLFALAACPTAGAFPVAQDLMVARAALPAGHPCKQAVTIQPRPGLPGLAGAPIGVLIAQGWMQRLTDGRLEPLDCVVRVNPAAWARLTACGRRRALVHEVMHLGGHGHSEGGIMAESPQARARVAVSGCPPARGMRRGSSWESIG